MGLPIAIDPAFLRMQEDSLLDPYYFSVTGGAKRSATHPAPGGTNPLAEPTPPSARRRDSSSRGGGRELPDPKEPSTP